MTTVKRSDISITEQIEYSPASCGEAPKPYYKGWVADLDGRLSTGEYVFLIRNRDTFEEAKTAIEEAIAAQGWSIE